jgi:3-oxoacyl-[acyl-carrier protein] reductase
MEARKVAVVTASAGAGIGGAVARRLASDGMTVVITDAHERRCGEVAERLSAEHGREMPGIPLDVTNPEAVERTMREIHERLGGIDVLVNNAGWAKLQLVSEMDLENWRHTIDVDLNGTFYCLRYALPYMIERGSGAVVNISSTAAWEAGTHHGAYAAAKAAVCALTRAVASEVGPSGIRVNAIAPGLIYNEFLRRIYPDDFFDSAVERTMIGRVGQPEDVSALVSFLVSDAAGYITGEVYGISGGESPHA